MKYFNKIILLLIILFAFFLRTYQLGQNPPSLDWDEASLGYNAYSILKTGADEYGNKFPLAFRSFGDYKPPLYVYLTVPSVAIFGLNEFAVRFPSAIFGTLTVLLTYFLVKEIFRIHELPQIKTQSTTNIMALLAALFITISPWSLQFSRVAFESNIALFFFVSGILFFLKGLKIGWFLIISSALFVLSLYSYHSSRLVIPLLLFGFATYYYKFLWEKKKWVILAAIIGICLLFPLVSDFAKQGGARFNSVTSINSQGLLDQSIREMNYDLSVNNPLAKIFHNRRIIYFVSFLGGYLDHWNFDFLFLKGDAPGRHHAVDMGMLYLWDLPFVILGIYFLLKNKESANFPIFWWFLVAPVASALTTGTPHAVRSLLYLPTFQIFSAYGLLEFIKWLKEKRQIVSTTIIYIIVVMIISASSFNFIYYIHMYYIHTPVEVSQDWQYGYKQMVEEVSKVQDQYQKIIVTYRYDQPYIYFLFYQKIDPAWYQAQAPQGNIERFIRNFGKFEFININDFGKYDILKNTLIVGTGDEIPAGTRGIIKEIKFLNDKVAFRIVGR